MTSNSVLDSQDINIVEKGEKKYIIIGTAHISQESANLVKEVILAESPDCVVVELDEKRYKSLTQQKRWESLDIKDIIKKKQLSVLLVNLLLASYQKRLGEQVGVMPGTEFVEAIKIANEHNIEIGLADRDVRITFKRAWKSTPFWKKSMLIGSVIGSIFEKTEISEDKLTELRQKDALSDMMEELGKAMPTVKKSLIDERDEYLAEKIRQSNGNKIVVVVGAGHVPGILRILKNDEQISIDELEKIPPSSKAWVLVGWIIPVLIFSALTWIAMNKGIDDAGQGLLVWFLANGIPAAIGALLALGHPLTIIAAFVAAPFTSMVPLIGAGYVTALVQVFMASPRVSEFNSVAEDISVFKKWWSNRLLRIMLCFILPSLGSFVGTWVGGYLVGARAAF